jgi:hypothetical protein
MGRTGSSHPMARLCDMRTLRTAGSMDPRRSGSDLCCSRLAAEIVSRAGRMGAAGADRPPDHRGATASGSASDGEGRLHAEYSTPCVLP